jgi:serine/threonine protein kinase
MERVAECQSGSRAATEETAAVPFGRYEILSRHDIDGGGFDASARDLERGQDLRLWVGAEGSGTAAPGRSTPQETQKRLARVYQAALPRVLGSDVIEERAVLVVQAYRGETISAILNKKKFEVLEALDVAKGIGAALTKAHAAGVVHGAVSESEILLTEDGRPLLLHLGLGPFLGARAPRAPEDLGSEERAESGDVFGLSRLLCRCLLGEDPFARDHPEEAVQALREATATSAGDFPAELPEGLRRFLARAVHPDPSVRIHRAEEFTGDLRVIRASWDSMAASAPRPTILFSLIRHPRAILGGGLLLGVAGALILGMRACGS